MSSSFHELAQLRADWGDLDYAFLSPVYDSISKTGYGAAFEEAELGAALTAATVPVVALGGAEDVRTADALQLFHEPATPMSRAIAVASSDVAGSHSLDSRRLPARDVILLLGSS